MSKYFYVLKLLLRPKLLKEAIMAVEWENAELLDALAQYEKEEIQTNLSWEEDGLWYGWIYDPEKNRYYFDDIGNESIMGLWESQSLRKAEAKI